MKIAQKFVWATIFSLTISLYFWPVKIQRLLVIATILLFIIGIVLLLVDLISENLKQNNRLNRRGIYQYDYQCYKCGILYKKMPLDRRCSDSKCKSGDIRTFANECKMDENFLKEAGK